MPELRMGYHGSLELPHALIHAAGLTSVQVELVEYDVGDPFAPLRAGRVDLMISKFDHREPDLCYSATIAHDPRAVAVGRTHPLADRAEVSVEDVADHPAFDRPGSMPADVWDQIVPPVTPAGRPIRRAHPLTTVPDMMRLIAAGAAVHLTVLSIADIAPPAVRVRPVPDLPPAPVHLAWRPDAPAPVRAFVAAVESARTVVIP